MTIMNTACNHTDIHTKKDALDISAGACLFLKIGGSPNGHGALTCGHVIGGCAAEGSSLGKVIIMGGDNTMPVNVCAKSGEPALNAKSADHHGVDSHVVTNCR